MPNKRIKESQNHDNDIEEDEESGSENDSDFDSDGNYVGEKELQADFEGRNPEDCDFYGIKQLLRQLFLKSDVDLGELAQLIISQNYIGSVVKQCLDDDQEEDDDEDDGSDGVFGVTTIINITKQRVENSIQQIRTLLTTLAEDNADDKTKGLIKKILEDDSNNHVGLVINERILNIPAAISVPLFSSLESELEKAVKKNKPYNFQYLVWISKTYKTDVDTDLLYANQEEKPITSEAVVSFEVDVSDQVDFSQWDYEGGSMTPGRKVLIFEAKKFSHLVRLMKQEVEDQQKGAV